jgi:hypothetical protein
MHEAVKQIQIGIPSDANFLPTFLSKWALKEEVLNGL